MTMVCIHTEPDRVTVVRDGLVYTPAGDHIAASRVEVVHLDAVQAITTTRGDHTLAELWTSCATDLAARCADAGYGLDLFLLAAPTTRQGIVTFVHQAVIDQGGIPPADPHDLHVYIAGWSDSEGRFISRILRSGNDFQPEPIEDLHLTPAPVGAVWTDVERTQWDGLAEAFTAAGLTQPDIPPGRPTALPVDDDDWESLARRIHTTRGCAHPHTGLKVPVGGTVTRTRLTTDGIDRADLFTFSDTDHARMLAHTLASKPTPRRSAGKPGRNDPCPCGSGTKYKRCCAMATA